MTDTCPTCGQKIKAPKTTTYTDEFQSFWIAYDAPKRTPAASKSEAYKAWNQIADKRPPIEALLTAIRAYHRHTDANRSITCHPATWLRQGRYENFLPRTDSMGSIPQGATSSGTSVPSVDSSWPGEIVVELTALIGPSRFQTWLGESKFQPKTSDGGPVVITVNSPFKRDYLVTKFASALFRVLGVFEVEVARKE